MNAHKEAGLHDWTQGRIVDSPNYNGATNPCRKCGLSHRNTVHTNKGQFGYHQHEPVPDSGAEGEGK